MYGELSCTALGLGHQLPFRIPVNHIKLAPHAKQSVEGHYVVKKILSHRLIDDKTEYLVRWEKESIMDSWVLAEHFDGGSMVDDYIRKHKVYIDQSHAESSIGQSAQDTIAAADQSHAESGIGQSAQDTVGVTDARLGKQLSYGAAGSKNFPALGKRKRIVLQSYDEHSGSEKER